MKFGVNSIFACWISSLGISSRRLALELVKYYPNQNDNSFTNFMRWAVNLSIDFLFQELPVGSVTEKERFIAKMRPVKLAGKKIQTEASKPHLDVLC